MHDSLETQEDAALVVYATLGSIRAFDALIRRYRRPIMLVAEQIVKSRAIAEEVAQETFLSAFKALPTLEAPGAVGGWLRAIARNTALKTLQRERRTTPTDDLEALVRTARSGLSGAPKAPARPARGALPHRLRRLEHRPYR
jgi:RNA polymerase sigma-70 factor, ECF subfamily